MRFARLGQWVVRRRRWVLGVAAVGFVVAGSYGADVASHLSTGGFADPGSASARASDYLTDTLGSGTPNVVILVTPTNGRSVDEPAIVAAGTALTEELAAQPGVDQAASYWTLDDAPPLRAGDASSADVRLHVLIDARDGYLTGERLRAAVPEWREASIWFCGPTDFGKALRRDLARHGFPVGQRFHQELFAMR